MLKSIKIQSHPSPSISLKMQQLHYQQMTDESPPHASFPFIAVAIIGIFATIFLLVCYYIFAIKCCFNWHILCRFSLSRNTNHYPFHDPSSAEPTGLHESVIRSIPIFHFQKQIHSDIECVVCLGEFQDDERLRIIPNCAHVFHIDCIDVWLQNNPNCPICRNSISMHIPLLQHPTHVPGNEEDYVVIELHRGEERNVSREYRNLNFDEQQPVARKIMEKLRKRYGYDSSMGDECIGVNSRRKGEDQLLIRRSFSMDSAPLYLAVQEIKNSLNHVDVTQVNDGYNTSNSRLRRGFFSFGSAILPFHL